MTSAGENYKGIIVRELIYRPICAYFPRRMLESTITFYVHHTLTRFRGAILFLSFTVPTSLTCIRYAASRAAR